MLTNIADCRLDSLLKMMDTSSQTQYPYCSQFQVKHIQGHVAIPIVAIFSECVTVLTQIETKGYQALQESNGRPWDGECDFERVRGSDRDCWHVNTSITIIGYFSAEDWQRKALRRR